MDEPVGQHGEWNKPNTERQILYDFIYMWNLKNSSSQSREKNGGYWGLEDNEEMLVKGVKLSVIRWVSSEDLMYSGNYS